MRALQAQDARVNAAAWRLTTGAVALCPIRQPTIGVALHTLDAYRGQYRIAAQRLLRLDQGAGVLAVAPGSPAEAAGLRADDIITAIDGSAPVQPGRGEIGSVVVLAQLTAALADGAVVLRTGRGDLRIAARPACASRFEVTTDDDLVAQADGKAIQISAGLVEQADTDDALAAVLAHELAHNVLRHRARLESVRGGRRDRLFWSREIEIEADRFALRLLDRAGFSVDAAIGFWTDYARRLARDTSGRGSHPDWRARLAAMRDEARLIHNVASNRSGL